MPDGVTKDGAISQPDGGAGRPEHPTRPWRARLPARGWPLRAAATTLLFLLGCTAIVVSAASLRELASREWLASALEQRVATVRRDYDIRKRPLLELGGDGRERLAQLERDEQAVVQGLTELRGRVAILSNVGATRISSTARGVADLMEVVEVADRLPEERIRVLVGQQEWQRPSGDGWHLAVAVDTIRISTSYDRAPHQRPTTLWGRAWEVWVDMPERLASDLLLQMLAASLGFLGGCLATAVSSGPGRVVDALMGAVFGLFAFFLIKGGKSVFVFDAGLEAGAFNHYTVAVLAFLAGLFQERFRALLASLVSQDRAADPGAPQGPAAGAG